MSDDTIHVKMIVDYSNPVPAAFTIKPALSDKIFILVTQALLDGDPVFRDMAIYHELGHVRHGHLDGVTGFLIDTDLECEADEYAAVHFPNKMDHFFTQLKNILNFIPNEDVIENEELYELAAKSIDERTKNFRDTHG